MDSHQEKIRNLKGEIVEETIIEVANEKIEGGWKKEEKNINRAVESNDIESK